MLVRITLKAGYGPQIGDHLPCGTEVNLPDRLAIKLIAHGIAVSVPKPPKVERAPEAAVRAPTERTTRPKPRRR